MTHPLIKTFIHTLDLEAQALRQACDRMEHTPDLGPILDTAAQRIKNGGMVHVIGLGKSGKIAAKIVATLSSTGTPATFVHPTEALHGDLGVVRPHDVVLALSQTGNTAEVIEVIPYFRSKGAWIIAMTGNADSKLAQSSDCTLLTLVQREACPHNMAPTTSSTLQLAMGDAFAMALMKSQNFSVEEFAKNHPGGALGRRLTLRVSDLMKPLAQIPCVDESASTTDVVDLSTAHKLGAVCVVNTADSSLVGVITDGDIRRALRLREQFFKAQAKDIMTRSPMTCQNTDLAFEALQFMENRPSQISVLPVVDHKNTLVGLVRLHDLVQSL